MSALSGLNSESKKIAFTILMSLTILAMSALSPVIAPRGEHITPSYLLFFTTSLAIFYSSIFFIGMRVNSWRKIPITPKRLLTIFTLIIAVALVSRVLDRFFIRPPSNYFSVLSYRQAREADSNLFSVLSTLLFPFCLILYGKIKSLKVTTRKENAVFAIAFALIIIDILMSGSRGILLVSIVALFFDKINRRNIAIYAAMFILASGFIFSVRFSSLMQLDDMGSSLINLSSSGYSYFVPASRFFLEILRDSEFKLFFFSMVQSIQYFAHGLFEFAYIYETHPSFQFDLSALLPQLSKIQSSSYSLERAGAYYTLPGTLYLSFGLLSLMASAICGIIIGALYKRSAVVSENAQGVLLLSVFLAPFVNGIGGFDIVFFLASIYIVSALKVNRTIKFRRP